MSTIPNLTAMAMAVDNSRDFEIRVGIAARYFGKEMTDHLQISVALACQAGIVLTGPVGSQSVDTTGVTDAQIVAAVQAYDPSTDPNGA